jgi:hypothetical protein
MRTVSTCLGIQLHPSSLLPFPLRGISEEQACLNSYRHSTLLQEVLTADDTILLIVQTDPSDSFLFLIAA